MKWTYNGKVFTQDMAEDYFGFVYLITNTKTGMKYIGKKFLTKASYKQVKGKRRKIRKVSDWENYYGSSKYLHEDIKELGVDNFVREILHLCKSRSECAYLELKEQINREVLESDLFYNDWIQVRVRKEHLKSIHQK